MIEVRGLRKFFGKDEILKGLDLTIRPGDRIALVGQNGSGKTTLIRCLLGFYQFTGDITVNGLNTRGHRPQVLGQIGFVPQLPPGLRVRVADYLRTMERVCQVSRQQIEAVAGPLGLDLQSLQQRRFSALSGGMKQKLLIAAAIARQPPILIMDEPGANLDPKSRAVFFRQLSETPRHTTMLLASHRVDEIAGLVNRVVELDQGTLVMDDIVAVDGGLTGAVSPMAVSLRVTPGVDTMKKAFHEWGLEEKEPLHWTGQIPAADRYRFFALLTRYGGLLRDVKISPAPGAEGRPQA